MKRRRTHTDDGLPRATADWTAEDWRDLHEAVEQAKARIAARHRPKDTPEERPMSSDTAPEDEPAAPPEKSGRFVVRLPKTVHAALCAEAAREGVSLNQLVVAKLSIPLARLVANPQH